MQGHQLGAKDIRIIHMNRSGELWYHHLSKHAYTRILTCCPVGQSILNSIALQLMRVCCSHYNISLELGIHNLADDSGIRYSYNQTVLG